MAQALTVGSHSVLSQRRREERAVLLDAVKVLEKAWVPRLSSRPPHTCPAFWFPSCASHLPNPPGSQRARGPRWRSPQVSTSLGTEQAEIGSGGNETTRPRAHVWEVLVWNTGDLARAPCSLRCCKVLPGKGVQGNQVGDSKLSSNPGFAALLCDPEWDSGPQFPLYARWVPLWDSHSAQTRQSLCSHCHPPSYRK